MNRLEILAVLSDVQQYLRETHEYWDGDEDHKVGKRIAALAGYMPKYHPVPDRLQALIKTLENPLTELT